RRDPVVLSAGQTLVLEDERTDAALRVESLLAARADVDPVAHQVRGEDLAAADGRMQLVGAHEHQVVTTTVQPAPGLEELHRAGVRHLERSTRSERALD